jgi:protein CMS1
MAGVTLQTSQNVKRHGSKRKRAPTDEGDQVPSAAKKIAPEPQKRPVGADGDIDESIGHMGPGLLSDHVAKKIRRSFRDLSTVELEDKHLSQKIFDDTSDFEQPRKLDNLPSFLEHFSDSGEELSSSSEQSSSPHTLVIAASGLRAADVTRSKSLPCPVWLNAERLGSGLYVNSNHKILLLQSYLPNTSNSQKLSIMSSAQSMLNLIHQCVCLISPRIGIGIGTPQRLIDLLEKDAMKTKNLKRIVIDGSHLDQKKRSIFDMKELLDPLIKLFSVQPIKDRLDGDEKRIKVLVF